MIKTTESTAMILAAGKGSRMGSLGENHPKALLEVAGKPLIQHHIEKLIKVGFNRIVINVSHLSNQIEAFLINKNYFHKDILISKESTPLETGGGIANAMPLINSDIFPVINADVYCDLPFSDLRKAIETLRVKTASSGYIFLVDNPPHHLKGDFALVGDRPSFGDKHTLTFSGIGIYKSSIFNDICPGSAAPLAPILKQEIKFERLLGCHFKGLWSDVGTVERLTEINQYFETN